MNKTDLIIELAAKMNVTQQQSKHFLNAFQEVLADTLQQDTSLMLQGFGTFEPWPQTKRLGRNPRTGDLVMIEPRTSVKFKPGKYLLEILNAPKK